MKIGTILCRVPSLSTDGVSYPIRYHPDGNTCDCPRFGFAKTCNHLPIYDAAVALSAKCVAAGHQSTLVDELGPWPRQLPAPGMICVHCLAVLLAAAARKTRRRFVPKEQVEELKTKHKAKVFDIRAKAREKKKR